MWIYIKKENIVEKVTERKKEGNSKGKLKEIMKKGKKNIKINRYEEGKYCGH